MNDAIKALAKAQAAMGPALKNAKNPHLKSMYADLGAVMDACFDALHSNEFAVLQPCGRDEYGEYVDTVLAHASGHMFTSRVHLVIAKPDMQGVGSAITYARRYGLLGLAGLAPEDDDGEATKPRRQEPREPAPPADHGAIHARLMAGIAKRTTKQQLTEFWDAEATARAELKSNEPELHAAMVAAFQAAGTKAADDKARQAPAPAPF